MTVEILQRTEDVREYEIYPDGTSHFEGCAPFTIRIGQYTNHSNNADLFRPPNFFVEIETRNTDIYNKISRVLDYKNPHSKLDEISYRKNGDESDVSYLTEFKIKSSRFSASILESFTTDLLDKLSTSGEGIISLNDANMILETEKNVLPSNVQIMGRD